MLKKIFKLTAVAVTMLLVLSALASCSFLDNILGGDEENTYTVTFDFDGGSATDGSASSVEVKEGETVKLPTVEKEGHTFLGWFVGDKPASESDTYTADTTITAKWQVTQVTVQFLNHLDQLMSEQVVDWGSAAVAPEPIAEIQGIPFKEWDTDYSSCKSDLVIRPIYARRTYTVSFNVGADATAVESQTVYYGETPVKPEDPDNMGCSLEGWYLDADFTTLYLFDTALDADTTIYAKFIADYLPIRSAADLIAISEAPNLKYVLLSDIDLGGNEWHPIESFTGALDGNGHKIYNFSMASTGTHLAFINQNSGLIKNLSFDRFSIEYQPSGATAHASVIAASNTGTIRNCQVLSGSFTTKLNWISANSTMNAFIAAVSGYNTGIVKNCVNNVDISIQVSTGSYGGGYSWETNYTTINLYTAGIVGSNLGTVKEAEAYGKLGITQSSTGVGSHGYCYNHFWVGGLVGSNGVNAEISESASYVQIVGNFGGSMNTKETYMGLIAGVNNSVLNDCLANGIITVTNESSALGGTIGGAVGSNMTERNINNVYADVDITVGDAVTACVAGYVAKNEAGATLTKAIYTGSISIGANVSEYGYICASKAGDILHCYYDSISILKVNGEQASEGTCTEGTATATITLLSESFIRNTLQWDADIWFITEGSAPTLNALK